MLKIAGKLSDLFFFYFLFGSSIIWNIYLTLFFSCLRKKTEKTNVEPEKGFASFRSSCFMHEAILKYDHEFGKRFVLFSCYQRYLLTVEKFLTRVSAEKRKEVGKSFDSEKFVVFRSVFSRDRRNREKSLNLHVLKSFEEFLSLQIHQKFPTLPLHLKKGLNFIYKKICYEKSINLN